MDLRFLDYINIMTRWLSVCLLILGFIGACQGVSSKLDFGEEEAADEAVVTNSSKEDDDVEVKHTIVVSTKLKNNNRRGLHTNEEPSFLHSAGNRNSKTDSGEVPIVQAYKSVDTTQIRTPDTRFRTTIYPDFGPMNRHYRHEYDIYPNIASSMHFKPSTFYNNINWWNQDNGNSGFTRNRPGYPKNNRRSHDDDVREFYCRKCRELSGSKGCFPRNSWLIESTTPRIKIDGKIAKLN